MGWQIWDKYTGFVLDAARIWTFEIQYDYNEGSMKVLVSMNQIELARQHEGVEYCKSCKYIFQPV